MECCLVYTNSLLEKNNYYVIYSLYLQIKMENLSEYCTCAGQFQTLLSRENLKTYLKTFYDIAKHFQMPALTQTIEWILKMSP